MGERRPANGVLILVAEDNPGDVRLISEALKDMGERVRLNVATDGVRALDLLRRKDEFAHAALPGLIILDLNLPIKHGKEVLAEIKADPDLKRIPVIVFSSSGAPQDVAGCYDLHANCYVIKPFQLDDFIETVKAIAHFWLGVATLPRE